MQGISTDFKAKRNVRFYENYPGAPIISFFIYNPRIAASCQTPSKAHI